MGANGWSPRVWHVGVPIAALVAGVLFATSATTSRGFDLRVTGRDDVNSLAGRQQRAVIAQGQQLAALQRQLQAATSDAAKSDVRVAQARQEAAGVADAAGLQPVSGPALTVSLNDAPPLPGKLAGSVPPDYLVVHQQDVQAVVNALWAGGAEAMTLQGQRVISTSAVRCVGNTLLLHGVVYSPPYTVRAIGDVKRLQQALNSAPDVIIYKQYVDAYKLGYRVDLNGDVTMPAYTGAVAMTHASPLDSASSAPNSRAAAVSP
ncbi:MAG: hypothetical protein QOG69_2461 [Actinomycetota bacterium]|nr:hypothetical protein [Actinomycetota bacterium]